jgi:hypothetical protein
MRFAILLFLALAGCNRDAAPQIHAENQRPDAADAELAKQVRTNAALRAENESLRARAANSEDATRVNPIVGQWVNSSYLGGSNLYFMFDDSGRVLYQDAVDSSDLADGTYQFDTKDRTFKLSVKSQGGEHTANLGGIGLRAEGYVMADDTLVLKMGGKDSDKQSPPIRMKRVPKGQPLR